MGTIKLGWEIMKKLPLAGLVDYAFKFGAQEGKNPDKDTLTNAYEGLKNSFPAKTYQKVMSAIRAGQNSTSKADGGMAYARKKNMGLKYKKGGGHMKKKSPMATYKKGGSVKSSSKKSRGTGAAIKGTKFKGVF
jgi:hypothetical protein